jgi:hypothetical protein
VFFIRAAFGTNYRFQANERLPEKKVVLREKAKILWTTLIITKVIYVSIWIVYHSYWYRWKVLIGFFIMHYTAGLILSVVFQLACCRRNH